MANYGERKKNGRTEGEKLKEKRKVVSRLVVVRTRERGRNRQGRNWGLTLSTYYGYDQRGPTRGKGEYRQRGKEGLQGQLGTNRQKYDRANKDECQPERSTVSTGGNEQERRDTQSKRLLSSNGEDPGHAIGPSIGEAASCSTQANYEAQQRGRPKARKEVQHRGSSNRVDSNGEDPGQGTGPSNGGAATVSTGGNEPKRRDTTGKRSMSSNGGDPEQATKPRQRRSSNWVDR